MAKVLFEITEDHLETGMRGYPIGYCTTSTVDPIKGLFYINRAVEQVAYWEPEEVIYLLYYGKEGTAEEVSTFSKDLQKRAKCSSETIAQIRLLPRKGHPMELFCAALMIAGIFEKTGDYQKDCLNLIAKIPEITATVINHHAG